MLETDNPIGTTRHFAWLGCMLFSLFAWTTVSPAAVLDQSQDATSSNFLVGPGDQRIAQTFTPGIEGTLEKVRVRIGYLPSTAAEAGDLLLEVMNTDSNGVPNGTVLGSASLAHAAFPLAGGFFSSEYTDFDLTGLPLDGVPLHAGTLYAFALRVAGGATCSVPCSEPAYRANHVFAANPYSPGQLFLGTGVVPTFAPSGDDLSFQTFTTAAAAIPEPAAWLTLFAGLAALAATRKLRTRHRHIERQT